MRATVDQLLGDALQALDHGLATTSDGHTLADVRRDIASALDRLRVGK